MPFEYGNTAIKIEEKQESVEDKVELPLVEKGVRIYDSNKEKPVYSIEWEPNQPVIKGVYLTQTEKESLTLDDYYKTFFGKDYKKFL